MTQIALHKIGYQDDNPKKPNLNIKKDSKKEEYN